MDRDWIVLIWRQLHYKIVFIAAVALTQEVETLIYGWELYDWIDIGIIPVFS